MEAMLIFRKFNSIRTKKLFYSRGKKAKLPFKNLLLTIHFYILAGGLRRKREEIMQELQSKISPDDKDIQKWEVPWGLLRQSTSRYRSNPKIDHFRVACLVVCPLNETSSLIFDQRPDH